MNKEQAIHSFWSSYGIPAYDEATVPNNAKMPYITYSVATGGMDDTIGLTATIWYRATTWKDITEKVEEIAADVGLGGKLIKIDNGYAWLRRGSTFSQRIQSPDDMVRAYYLQIMAEFLTEN